MIRLLALLVLLPVMAQATPCKDVRFLDKSFTICTVDVAQDRLELFLKGPDAAPLGSFRRVESELANRDARLGFAMNAGMYHADRSPVGLYIQDGVEQQRLVTAPGPGNFGLLPNGVLCVGAKRVDVIETLRFKNSAPTCRFATQSGPMLVIDGALHPRFLPNSTSRYVRNGVGTSEDGKLAIFAISNERVTFHEFGRLFRDYLKMPQALYLDGNISRLHAPQMDRSDLGLMLGPIIGTVVPQ